MAYRVSLAKSAAKEMSAISAKTHDRIIEKLRQLEADPRPFGAERLTGIAAYKIRVGDFRIIYEINDADKAIRIVMVDDRKQVYKRVRRKK